MTNTMNHNSGNYSGRSANNHGSAGINQTGGMVLNDITKSFNSTPVLSGISLSIQPGETVAVMGPSGSGKSTLLHCMSGVLVPDSGSVRVGDVEVSSGSDAQRSAMRLNKFGFVFQDGQLLPELTARENVALPEILRGTSQSKALKTADDMLTRLGLGELLGRRPGKMSGGQAQRVAIARAIAAQPEVIFADEPTGALDQQTGHEVMQQLIAIVEQSHSTLVMVTHDSKVANWCRRRIEIRDGIIHDDRMLAGVANHTAGVAGAGAGAAGVAGVAGAGAANQGWRN